MSQASEYREAELAAFDALPIREGCLFCEWVYLGTALDGRQEALQHRKKAHPDTGRNQIKRPKNRHLARFHQPELDEEELAEVKTDRVRRARLHGVDLY